MLSPCSFRSVGQRVLEITASVVATALCLSFSCLSGREEGRARKRLEEKKGFLFKSLRQVFALLCPIFPPPPPRAASPLACMFFKSRIVAIERWVGKSEQEDFECQVCSWTWDDLDIERKEKTISIFFFSPPLRFFFSFSFEYFLLFRFSLLQ